MKKFSEFCGEAVVVLAVIALAIPAFALPAFPVPQDQNADSQKNKPNFPPDFMGVAGISGWTLVGAPQTFLKEGLHGYLDGGAEIFLQYGFQDLTVFDLVPDKEAPPKKEISLEIYRMDSPKAAFGIFSTRREGGESVAAGIKTFHWLGQEKANLVKGNLYVNILASSCTQAEIGDFVASLAAHLPSGETPMPEDFSCMPDFSLVPRTERYICGDIAATNESPLLGADFWGFKEGLAEAYSVKYGPGLSKLVLIHFKQRPENLVDKVLTLFNENLTDVTVLDQVMQGRTATNSYYMFGWNGPNSVIILDEPDPKVARKLIQEALDKAAKQLEKKSEKAPSAGQ
jgi:hypothetical protein